MLTLSVIGALLIGVLALWCQPQAPRLWPLLAIAAAPQLANLVGLRVPWMFFFAIAVIEIWCIYNHTVPGTLIVAIGIGLNLLVMAFHGGAMPIRADILASLGQLAVPGTELVGSKDVVILSSELWQLSDWIVLSFGATKVVVSPGDLIIIAGVAWWLLFSHLPKKDQAHADTINHPSLTGATHAPTTGTK